MYIIINNNIRNIRDILVVFACKKYSFNTKKYNELYRRNVMFNFCTVLLPVLVVYKGRKVKQEFSQHNYASTGNGIVYLILAIFGLSIVSMAIMQSDFNSLKSETHLEQRSTYFYLCKFLFLKISKTSSGLSQVISSAPISIATAIVSSSLA